MPEGGEGESTIGSRGDAPVQPKVGVLFVHGIGAQGKGDTLLGFGEPLCRWLDNWLGHQAAPVGGLSRLRVTGAQLTEPTDPSHYSPPHAKIRFANPLTPQSGSLDANTEWLLAESWWASSFQSAKFGELRNWGFGLGPLLFIRAGIVWAVRPWLGFIKQWERLTTPQPI